VKPRSIILTCSQYFSTHGVWMQCVQLGQPTSCIIKATDCELGRGPVSRKCILAPWLRKEKIGRISASIYYLAWLLCNGHNLPNCVCWFCAICIFHSYNLILFWTHIAFWNECHILGEKLLQAIEKLYFMVLDDKTNKY